MKIVCFLGCFFGFKGSVMRTFGKTLRSTKNVRSWMKRSDLGSRIVLFCGYVCKKRGYL